MNRNSQTLSESIAKGAIDRMEQGSEVARAMRQIDPEREAADRALHGFAITSRHDFINARMQRSGERILRLIDEGKHEEAQILMNHDDWGGEGERQTKQQSPAKRTKRQKSGNRSGASQPDKG